MNKGLKVMKVRGIEIRLDWTLLIISSFITLSLATGYFPAALPGWGAAAYLTAALLTCVGLYASVLLHELAHSLLAQRFGIKVENIVLHLFGGVSNLKEEARNPRQEFWISIVGPLTSLGLAAGFFGAALVSGGFNAALAAMTGYLALINLALALFNLIPAFPLDGGRVLRALLWGRTGNLVKATSWAAKVGRGVGWGFVALGLFLALNGSIFDGLWLMLIGWFLSNAARVSYSQTVVEQGLQGLTVGQVAWRGNLTLSSEMKTSEVLPFLFNTERGRVLPVVENGFLLGVINPETVRKLGPEQWQQTRVVDVMERRGSLLAFKPEEALQPSLEKLATKPAQYGVVIGEGGQFAGLIYLQDLPRFVEMRQVLDQLDPKGQRSDPAPASLDRAA